MFEALAVKLLIQFGSNLLLSFAKASVTTLQARQDNDLDIGAETVKLVLNAVTVAPK